LPSIGHAWPVDTGGSAFIQTPHHSIRLRQGAIMAAEEKFVFESLQDTNSIKDFLKSLTEGIEKGKVTLSTNGDEIELYPSGLLQFSVKVKRKGSDNKMNIKIAWKDDKKNQSILQEQILVS
jgi:amphi-Trp domain-containing protein